MPAPDYSAYQRADLEAEATALWEMLFWQYQRADWMQRLVEGMLRGVEQLRPQILDRLRDRLLAEEGDYYARVLEKVQAAEGIRDDPSYVTDPPDPGSWTPRT